MFAFKKIYYDSYTIHTRVTYSYLFILTKYTYWLSLIIIIIINKLIIIIKQLCFSFVYIYIHILPLLLYILKLHSLYYYYYYLSVYFHKLKNIWRKLSFTANNCRADKCKYVTYLIKYLEDYAWNENEVLWQLEFTLYIYIIASLVVAFFFYKCSQSRTQQT